MESLLVSLHAITAALWVGALFYARFILPAGLGKAEPEARLAVLGGTVPRLMAVAMGAAALLLISGYALLFQRYDGFADVGAHVHVMILVWLVMAAIAAFTAAVPARRLAIAAKAGDVEAAAKPLKLIRIMTMTNVKLGIIGIILGAAGPALFY